MQRDIEDRSFKESQSSFLDAYNNGTFGGSHGSTFPKSYADVSRNKFTEEANASSICPSMVLTSSLMSFGTMFPSFIYCCFFFFFWEEHVET